jgi:hypothetical protein
MERLERVRRMTCRRMDQVDSELERFEERPELDTCRRYTSLLKRLVELENLYYNLLRKQAPNPYDLIERILAERSSLLVIEPEFVVSGSGSALNIGLEGSAYGN